MKYTRTIKFKMAIWYSVMLLVFSLIFIIAMNLLLQSYLRTDINTKFPMFGMRNPIVRELNEEKRQLILESRMRDIENIRRISAYSLVPFVVLSFVGGYVIADRNLRPLEKLRVEMNNRSADNLSEEIEFEDSGNEISDLIRSFNRMSQELGRVFRAQREFVENASHEIKTPLAVLQANIESIQEDKDMSKKEIGEILEESKSSVLFMNKLTEDLLLLSMVNSNIKLENLNIHNLLLNIKNDASKFHGANEFDIVVIGDKDLQVSSNEVLLKRAIQNLLENAIKYSKGNRIELKMDKRHSDGRVIITVSDNGSGIPEEYRSKIFDRFYRIDRSRSRSTGGSGLGLAITKEVVEKLGGSIRYKESALGATFEIVI